VIRSKERREWVRVKRARRRRGDADRERVLEWSFGAACVASKYVLCTTFSIGLWAVHASLPQIGFSSVTSVVMSSSSTRCLIKVCPAKY
jgi:hypothetical protein